MKICHIYVKSYHKIQSEHVCRSETQYYITQHSVVNVMFLAAESETKVVHKESLLLMRIIFYDHFLPKSTDRGEHFIGMHLDSKNLDLRNFRLRFFQ